MKVQKRSKMLRDSMLHKTVRGKGRTENLSTHRSSVRDAVKNVKKMLEQKKRSQSESIGEHTNERVNFKIKRPWKFRSSRGIVYVGHIPHGFYEEQMQEYFKQFGNVTRVRVARSKNTGRSRGYGYVEFSNNEVAKIAADSMNNYLMCGRLLKATYVPPEKQHAGFFSGKDWTENEYPKLRNRELSVLQKNGSIKGKVDYIAYTKNVKRKLVTLEKKLEARGIKLNFKPVDDVET